jgi:hypothetical protein
MTELNSRDSPLLNCFFAMDPTLIDATQSIQDSAIALQESLNTLQSQPFSELIGKLELLDHAKLNVTMSMVVNALSMGKPLPNTHRDLS